MTRWIAPGGVFLGSLLLCGCSAVGTPEPACRPLEVAEFPLLGGIRGTWMDDERFVLADLHQSRLFVYGTSEGLVRVISGWEGEDLELNFVSPMDVQPWGDGFVLADSFRDAERLFELDAGLRPVRLLWEGDARHTEEGWVGEEIVNLGELVALDDRLYLRAERFSGPREANREYAEFGLDHRSDPLERALGERRAWPGFAGERDSPGMPLRHLAASGRRSATVFALRYAPAVFIQELVGEGRSLKAFPELPTPLPTLPQASQDRMAEFYAALEASSYPAGLYGDEDSLYVLMRDATSGAPVWDLHRIDPRRDEVIGTVRLPTRAAHVSLLPGRRYWVLEESSSGLDRPFRPPFRFLLLSSAALRAGEVPLCDRVLFSSVLPSFSRWAHPERHSRRRSPWQARSLCWERTASPRAGHRSRCCCQGVGVSRRRTRSSFGAEQRRMAPSRVPCRVCTVWQDPNLPDWFGTLRRCAESRDGGAFELAGLPAGNVQATASALGFETDSRAIEQGRRASRVVFELVAREESAAEAATAPTGAGEVRVELVGAAGEPIRNFTLRTNAVGRMGGASHDVEDADGPVLVPISPSFAADTAVDISFRAENYLESPLIRVTPIPGGEIELGLIALDPGSVVQGRLFDAVGAEPAAGCGAPIGGQVSLIGDVGRTVAYAEAGDDGRFELPPAPPGSYRLKASAGVSPTRVREGRSSRAGTVVQDLALGTEPPPHLVLRVEDAETGVLEVELQRTDGSPAAGAWLHFVNASGDMVNTSLASAAGQASRNLPAGDISLVWNDGAACTGGLGLNVEAGRTATARESLPIGRLLELRCPAADCRGESLSFLSVTTESGAEIASHLTGAGESVRFSDSGRLGLGCVTPGAYEISFWAAGRRWGVEVNVGSRGNLEEPVVVNGRAAGL